MTFPAIHPLSRRCCCCCGGTNQLAQRRLPAAGETFPRVGLLFEGQPQPTPAPEEHTGPVWVVSTCGSDRDCIPDARWQPDIQTARNGAASWILRNLGRRVDIYTGPGGALLESHT